MNTAVLGASADPEKYSNKAVRFLLEKGHRVFPVHPKGGEVEGLKVYRTLGEISEPVDTLTLYVSAAVSTQLQDQILALKPRRVIFNPGAENPALAQAVGQAGIQTLEACTLVLLRTSQF
ncbi:MAG: hypothetical protein MOGMAGMI_01324 [Candidatus Omnitrophica bacterium]|nr:hypothetical protein [Candidatus Omnitrophota bacterium]